jgi:hypothetical protein
MAADDEAGVDQPRPRRTGGLRLNLSHHPLVVFVQSFLPWAHAS